MAKYELNIAVVAGVDWTGKAPKFEHFALVQLGEDLSLSANKADIIMTKFGKGEYKFTFRTIETNSTVEEL